MSVVFGLAAVRASVWQRLCLEAIVADIAEIVGHEICTSLSTGCYKMVEYCCVVKCYPGTVSTIARF